MAFLWYDSIDVFLNTCPMKPAVISHPLNTFGIFPGVYFCIKCSTWDFSVKEGDRFLDLWRESAKGRQTRRKLWLIPYELSC